MRSVGTDPERDRHDIELLKSVIRTVMARHKDDEKISPFQIATEVLGQTTAQIRYVSSHLQIRQLTRGMCRHDYDDKDHRQPFLPNLPLVQRRYPAEDGSGYIKAEVLDKADGKFNVRRLRGKGNKIISHSNQLELYLRDRIADWDDDVDEQGNVVEL